MIQQNIYPNILHYTLKIIFSRKKVYYLVGIIKGFFLTQCSVVIKRTLVLLFIDICSQIAKVLTTLLFNIDV